MPYSKQVQKVLEEAGKWDINMICPSHGVIWTAENIPEILSAYHNWAYNIADDYKALIIYDTMWKSTQKLAYTISAAFEAEGIRAQLVNLQNQSYFRYYDCRDRCQIYCCRLTNFKQFHFAYGSCLSLLFKRTFAGIRLVLLSEVTVGVDKVYQFYISF